MLLKEFYCIVQPSQRRSFIESRANLGLVCVVLSTGEPSLRVDVSNGLRNSTLQIKRYPFSERLKQHGLTLRGCSGSGERLSKLLPVTEKLCEWIGIAAAAITIGRGDVLCDQSGDSLGHMLYLIGLREYLVSYSLELGSGLDVSAFEL